MSSGIAYWRPPDWPLFHGLLEEPVALEPVRLEHLGRQLLEQAGRGERREPRGVHDRDVGRRAADRRQRQLRVVRVAPRQDQLADVAVGVLGVDVARISVSRSPSPPPNRCQNVTVSRAARNGEPVVATPSAAAAPTRRAADQDLAAASAPAGPALPLHAAQYAYGHL